MAHLDLDRKVALVTGAASGIGRAVALAYARAGARVVVSDVDADGARETVALVHRGGGYAVFKAADVSRPDDCRALVEAAVRHYGGEFDVACNNAGIGGPMAPTADYPVDGWDRVIAVNLSGVFYGMKYQIAQMLRGGGGAIVNVASILGQVGFANAPAYVAAKHGVVGLTKTAAIEYAAQRVRVNAVGPAFIHTPMIAVLEADAAANAALVAQHPIGRLGTAEEVAELVLWLSTPRASFVTGAYYAVDGGYLAR
jgi:NAD(P)-dependent dehydrogenase (short-subunit alcohol dehydrogenase family)